jgi:2-phosphosulfolactate phosphatase
LQIRVAATPELFRPRSGWIAVIIDVLRFTTCVAAALQSGADAILPCTTVEEALNGRQPGELLSGERQSRLIPGFDLGNSPHEFLPAKVAGRRIRCTTTNGTLALRAADSGLCAALVNRAAVARRLAGMGAPTCLVCAGNQGAFGGDDWLAAGALVAGLRQAGVELEPDDASRAAESWFLEYQMDLPSALARSDHGRHLVSGGFLADLELCGRLDLWEVVPDYRDGAIRNHPGGGV